MRLLTIWIEKSTFIHLVTAIPPDLSLREDLLVLEKVCSNDAEAVSHSFYQKHNVLRAVAQTPVER